MFAAKIHRHPTQRAAADAAGGGGGGNYAGLVKPVLRLQRLAMTQRVGWMEKL